MNSDNTLEFLRALCKEVKETNGEDKYLSVDLASMFLYLDEKLSKGVALPGAWTHTLQVFEKSNL